MASRPWSVAGSLSGLSRHAFCISPGKVLSYNTITDVKYSRQEICTAVWITGCSKVMMLRVSCLHLKLLSMSSARLVPYTSRFRGQTRPAMGEPTALPRLAHQFHPLCFFSNLAPVRLSVHIHKTSPPPPQAMDSYIVKHKVSCLSPFPWSLG